MFFDASYIRKPHSLVKYMFFVASYIRKPHSLVMDVYISIFRPWYRSTHGLKCRLIFFDHGINLHMKVKISIFRQWYKSTHESVDFYFLTMV